jgi:ornithine cyclodeaminase
MLTVRPLQEIIIWGRDSEKAAALCSELSSRFHCHFRATRHAAEAAACDIICTVTGSTEPVLKGEWVRLGAHINLVGAHALNTREADTALIAKSKLYVDLLESTLNESGDVMIPVQEGAINQSDIVGELGTLIAGKLPGRQQSDDITVYNSLGITIQDLYAAHYVMDKARQTGVGVVVD